MAAKKKSTNAFEFIKAALTKNKNATFAEIRDAGAKKGLKIAPISYGRAKSLLGLIPAGGGKKKRQKASTGRKPGRPRGTGRKTTRRGAAAAANLGELESVIRAIKDNEAQAKQYRTALERIRQIIDGAL